MLIIILAAGLYFSFRTRFVQLRLLGHSCKLIVEKPKDGHKQHIHQISIGYRLLESCWGRGIACEALSMMVDYLYSSTDIGIITASSMVDNTASARVLQKNGFDLVAHAVDEEWGFAEPTPADK